MLPSFLFPSLYQEPDLARASLWLNFPGYSGVSEMTTRGAECQWLRLTHEEMEASWLGSEDTLLGRTSAL